MSHRLEFYFDCSSPWTYLAFEYAQRRLADLDLVIEWKPILVGGIFNTVNPSVYASREKPVVPKARYMRKDLQDWAAFVGLDIGWPEVFPVNSVKAMRGASSSSFADDSGGRAATTASRKSPVPVPLMAESGNVCSKPRP